MHLATIVGTLLASLMIITFVDVIGRKLGHPISYAFELTQIAMGLMIYIGLPLVTAKREHIVIDLLLMNFSSRLRRVLQVTMDIACCFMTFVVAWQLWLQAGKLAASNNVLMFTRIPLAPIVYVMGVMTAITGFVLVSLIIAEYTLKQKERED